MSELKISATILPLPHAPSWHEERQLYLCEIYKVLTVVSHRLESHSVHLTVED
jgi:hypothetical protein